MIPKSLESDWAILSIKFCIPNIGFIDISGHLKWFYTAVILHSHLHSYFLISYESYHMSHNGCPSKNPDIKTPLLLAFLVGVDIGFSSLASNDFHYDFWCYFWLNHLPKINTWFCQIQFRWILFNFLTIKIIGTITEFSLEWF